MLQQNTVDPQRVNLSFRLSTPNYMLVFAIQRSHPLLHTNDSGGKEPTQWDGGGKNKNNPKQKGCCQGWTLELANEIKCSCPPWMDAVKSVMPEGRLDGKEPIIFEQAQIIKSSYCRAAHIKKLIGLRVASCCGHPWAKSCRDASTQLRQIVWLKIRLEHCQCPCLEALLKNEGHMCVGTKAQTELLVNNVPVFAARTHSSLEHLEKTNCLKP